MSETQVAVIVPVYNVAPYVGRCLDSLTRQTYRHLDIIVIDDGSTDESLAACRKAAEEDPRIRVLTQENKGLAAVRNRGLKECQADYFTFVDSDDLVADTYVDELFRICTEYRADVVQSDVYPFLDDKTIPVIDEKETVTLMDHIEACNALFDSTYNYGCAAVKFYRTSIYDGITFPEGKLHEDEFVVYRLLYKTKTFAVTNRRLYHYQSKRPDSITHAPYTLARLASVEAARERAAFFEQTGDRQLTDKAKAALCHTVCTNLDSIRQMDPLPDDQTDTDALQKTLSAEAKHAFRDVRGSEYLSMKRKINLGLHAYAPALWQMLRAS